MALIQIGNIVKIAPSYSTPIETLENVVYTVKYDEQTDEFYLEKSPDLKIPNPLYGTFTDVDIWLKSYKAYNQSMGVLLTGLKGSGKTVEMSILAKRAEAPIIKVPTGYAGPKFIEFLQSKDFTGSVVIIDEFEKLYSGRSKKPDQEALLTLLDGVTKTKLLFILTSNDSFVSTYLENRLGRIKFKKSYGSLDNSIKEAVIEDLLENKEHKDSIEVFFSVIGYCTYDLLVTLLKDMNLYGQPANYFLNLYNVTPDSGALDYFTGALFIDNTEVSVGSVRFPGTIIALYTSAKAEGYTLDLSGFSMPSGQFTWEGKTCNTDEFKTILTQNLDYSNTAINDSTFHRYWELYETEQTSLKLTKEGFITFTIAISAKGHKLIFKGKKVKSQYNMSSVLA